MSIFKQIVGSPTTGITTITGDSKISFLENVTSNGRWSDDSQNADSGAQISGDNLHGIIAASGHSIRYLRSLGNPGAQWRTAEKSFPEDKILALAGDNANGLAAIGSKGVYQLPAYDSKIDWKLLAAPFEDGVKPVLLSGDVKGGLLVVGGDDRDQVARSSADCCSWTAVPKSPIKIDIITGNITSGFIAYGESQLYALDAGKGVWSRLPRQNFHIVALSGNAKDGVVALLGSGDVVAYCTDLVKGPWLISQISANSSPQLAN